MANTFTNKIRVIHKQIVWAPCGETKTVNDCVKFTIQLFREKLSEKVHATIPKGIVGGFVCPVLQRNLKEWHERPRTYVREC